MFLGTDFGLKYVIADIDGEQYTISFRETFWKGIYDVSIRGGKHIPVSKVKSTYPGFLRRIQEMVLLIWVQLTFLKKAVKRRFKRNR